MTAPNCSSWAVARARSSVTCTHMTIGLPSSANDASTGQTGPIQWCLHFAGAGCCITQIRIATAKQLVHIFHNDN